MVYKVIIKKRCQNKLEGLLKYIEDEFGLLVAQKFASHLDQRISLLLQQPFIGKPSLQIENLRSLIIGKHNRLYYRVSDDKIILLNVYDTRINPRKNKLF